LSRFVALLLALVLTACGVARVVPEATSPPEAVESGSQSPSVSVETTSPKETRSEVRQRLSSVPQGTPVDVPRDITPPVPGTYKYRHVYSNQFADGELDVLVKVERLSETPLLFRIKRSMKAARSSSDQVKTYEWTSQAIFLQRDEVVFAAGPGGHNGYSYECDFGTGWPTLKRPIVVNERWDARSDCDSGEEAMTYLVERQEMFRFKGRDVPVFVVLARPPGSNDRTRLWYSFDLGLPLKTSRVKWEDEYEHGSSGGLRRELSIGQLRMGPRTFVVVSGPPASGKSTLAGALAHELKLPLIAKDTIKDALMTVLPVPDVEASRQLGRAAIKAMLAVAAASPIGAVIENNFHRSRATCLRSRILRRWKLSRGLSRRVEPICLLKLLHGNR